MARRSSRMVALVTAGALALAAAGVAVEGAGAATVTHPARVHPTAAAAPTSFAFSFSVSVTGLPTGPVSVTGKGAVDLAAGVADADVVLPPAVVSLIPGAGSSAETARVVLAGGTVYVGLPALAGLVGKPWVAVALPTAVTSALPGVGAALGRALGDVDGLLALAMAHGATVTPLGTRHVDGGRATGDQIAVALTTGPIQGSATAALWQDASGDLVRATLSLQGGGSLAGDGVSATLDVGRFDRPVTVHVPPAGRTVTVPLSTVTSLLGGLLHLPAAA